MGCSVERAQAVSRSNYLVKKSLCFEGGCGVLFFFFEVPGYGFLEAFVEVGFGLVAELGGGAGDVGEGVLDVAFALGAVDWFGVEAEVFGDGGVDLVESVGAGRCRC